MSNGASQQSWGLTVLRVIVGIVFLMHGGQKLCIYGFHGVAGMMATLGIPLPMISAVVVSLIEFLGGLALVAGLFARWAAALIAIDMVVAILAVHLKNGFFNPQGFEYPLTLLAACIALLLAGTSAASVDGALAKRT
jgi:putative oxidoreductase